MTLPRITINVRVKPYLGFFHFPNTTILVYDLGLSESEANYFMTNPNYIYKNFTVHYPNLPPHVKWLTSMAFKVLIITECLTDYQICLWFDTSIVFHASPDKLISKYVLDRGSSFVYYINPAHHNVAWATHPIMFSYLPSNISKFNTKTMEMSQGGAILLYNTKFLKQKIMQYAVACALTHECLAPNYELTSKRVPFGSFNPFGNFEHRYCNTSYNPWNHPFVCHRFDQSLWMILVANAYDFDLSIFRPKKEENIALADRSIGRRTNQ